MVLISAPLKRGKISRSSRRCSSNNSSASLSSRCDSAAYPTMSVNMMAASLRCSVLALIGRRPHKRRRLCKRCAASVRQRKNVPRSSFPRDRQMDAEFLAQGNEPRVVAVFENKRCYHQLGQTGIVGGVSIFEPAEHLIRFFAKSVDNGNLVGAVGRVFGGKILESGISRGAIGLRLLD